MAWLNDFIFCPASIYFHNLYEERDRIAYQETSQINGTGAHESIDTGAYSTRKEILCGFEVYCSRYGLIGKTDIFDRAAGRLIERKKKIKTVYDGYIFQLYGQCFALREMGFDVRNLALHSLDDNRTYPVPLPEDDSAMLMKFEKLMADMRSFEIDGFVQTNVEKCRRCIYEPLCSVSAGVG